MQTASQNSDKNRLTTAAALIAAAGFSALATANISKSYTSPTVNTWHITGLTDFDQQRDFRTANVPLAGLPASPGLPGGGGMYCVPTATMNMFAYAASHGYPGLQPGDQSYWNWQSQNWFDPYHDAATGDLAWLGGLMGTSTSGGTGPSGWWDGANEWVGNENIDLGMFLASTAWAPRAQNIGQIAHSGALTAICYGRYNFSVLSNFGTSQLTDRSGGHCVTTRRIDVEDANNAEFWYRDPGSSDSTWLQSTFANTVVDMDDSVYALPGFNDRVMSRLSLSTGDGRVRLLDKIYAVWPKQGLTSDPAGHTFAIDTIGGGFGIQEQNTNNTPFRVADIVPNSVLVDFEQSPMRHEIAGLFKDTDSGETSLVIMDVAALETAAIGSSPGGGGGAGKVKFDRLSIKKLAYSPEGALFAISDTELFKIVEAPTDSDGDGVVDSSDYLLWRSNFGASDADGSPIVSSDIRFDDASGTVRVLFPTIGEVRSYKWSTSGDADDRPTEKVAFYYNKVFGQDTEFAFDAKTGATVFGDNGSGELVGFLPCPNGEIEGCQVAATLAAPGGGTADMETDGKGNFYLVGADSVVRCFVFDPDLLLVRNVDAPFDGRPAGGFQITRSRTNYDPAIHAEWMNFPVEEVVAPDVVLADCHGDVTATGATLPGQPGYGVPDATVDLDDLGFYLNNWMAGELLADVTTTGATLEGQPGFGIADGATDLDDLGFYLNAWLVGCN